MANGQVEFYVRHRREITQWAALSARADGALRDAVSTGSYADASALLRAASGEPDIDFFLRHRAQIEEWEALQRAAGHELHVSLIAAARQASCDVNESSRAFTTVWFPDAQWNGQGGHDVSPRVELLWMQRDLLSTRGGFAFPRIALALGPEHGTRAQRARVRDAVADVARSVGLDRKPKHQVHDPIASLAEISDEQSIEAYASAAVERLRNVSAVLYPRVREAFAAQVGK